LFRKDRISFLAILHYIVEVKGLIRKTNFKLNHQPDYNNFSRESFFKKQLSWARLHAEYYLKDFSEIEKYNWQGNEWPKKILLRRKYPLLLIPLEFLVTVFKNLFSGAYRAGVFGIGVSFRTGVYRILVNYYIYKLKK
jgi:hypothetical protein